MRWIAHVDMDSFYVAVERLRNPRLAGLPVVVGGTGPRSVVASASYEARKFGVRSAQPIGQARRLCSNLIIVEPNFSEYFRVSKLVFSELAKLAPVVEQVSVDEAYLDFSGCERLFRSHEHAAKTVKEKVREISGLACTVGTGTSKLIAKIASDHAKPDGLLVVASGAETEFLASLTVRKLPGVGPKTAAHLEHHRIRSCGDLAALTPTEVRRLFGPAMLELHQYAQGIDNREVISERERKSLGSERTFHVDEGDLDHLCNLLREMSEDLATALRRENLKTRTVQIKIRYPDFTTHTRARTLEQPTHSAAEIAEIAQALLRHHKISQKPLRLLGVSVRNFTMGVDEEQQLSLFGEGVKQKAEKVERLKDQLKTKFGDHVLVSSASLKSLPTKR